MMSKRMSLAAGARTEFQQIVGDRFISDSPAMLSAYAWNTGVGYVPGKKKFTKIWPIAVVLPSTVEEVAATVKCCIRNGLGYKAHSTGYGSSSHVPTPTTVAIDLRRMSDLEIDARNRMAIIGPYVTAGMLQAEALKHGLTCHIVGAGPAHSPLASATSLLGVGITSQGTSSNMRNLLSWEWVTPQGEIVRGGSAGSDCGWFSGEGPGPGVRGMIRGFWGASGGLGVFTRIGYKLYPVPLSGPLQDTGSVPQIGMKVPENFGFYQAVWPNWESHRAASFELIDANVCFAMLRMPPDHIGWTVTATNAEYVDLALRGELPEVAKPSSGTSWTLMTTSRSAAEHQWRDSALKEIVERTGGRFIALSNEHNEVLFRNLLTSQYVPRVMRPSGGIMTSFGVVDSFQYLPRVMKAGEAILRNEKYPNGGLIEGGSEENWVWPNEGRYVWSENIIAFNPAETAGRKAAAHALLNHFAEYWKDPAGVLALGIGPIMDIQGDKIGAPQRYIRQLKRHLDPENASQSKDYVIVNMPELVQAALPKLKPILLSPAVMTLVAKVIASEGM